MVFLERKHSSLPFLKILPLLQNLLSFLHYTAFKTYFLVISPEFIIVIYRLVSLIGAFTIIPEVEWQTMCLYFSLHFVITVVCIHGKSDII